MRELLFWAAVGAIGIASGIAVVAGEYYRRCHPDRWRRTTGLDPATRLPVSRADQLVETRRRAGTPPWRSR